MIISAPPRQGRCGGSRRSSPRSLLATCGVVAPPSSRVATDRVVNRALAPPLDHHDRPEPRSEPGGVPHRGHAQRAPASSRWPMPPRAMDAPTEGGIHGRRHRTLVSLDSGKARPSEAEEHGHPEPGGCHARHERSVGRRGSSLEAGGGCGAQGLRRGARELHPVPHTSPRARGGDPERVRHGSARRWRAGADRGDVLSIAPNEPHLIHSHGGKRLRFVCMDRLIE